MTLTAATAPIIDADMRRIVESARLAFVATVCADGTPNLSPKGSLLVYDDTHLLFVDIASPGTISNLRDRPAIEVNVVDFLRRRGYRFKGTAAIINSRDDPVFRWAADWLLQTHGPKIPARHVVKVAVEFVKPLLSPAYTFLDAEEVTLAKAWAKKYALSE